MSGIFDIVHAVLGGCFAGWVIASICLLGRRITAIEKRDWPMKVVEWKTLGVIPTCRCQLAKTENAGGADDDATDQRP